MRWWARRQRSPPRSGRCWVVSSPPICPGASGSRSRRSSSPSCSRTSSWCATCRTRGPGRRLGRSRPLGAGHGRRRAQHPGLAGGRRVGRAFLVIGVAALAALGSGCGGAGAGQADLARPRPVRLELFRLGISGQMLQQIALGGMMIALPIYLQMVRVQRHGRRPVAGPALVQHVRDRAAGRERRAAGGPAGSSPSVSRSPRSGCWCWCRSSPGPTRAGIWSSHW